MNNEVKQSLPSKKSKGKLAMFVASYCIDFASSKSGEVGNQKQIKTGKDKSLDVGVMQWCI